MPMILWSVEKKYFWMKVSLTWPWPWLMPVRRLVFDGDWGGNRGHKQYLENQ